MSNVIKFPSQDEEAASFSDPATLLRHLVKLIEEGSVKPTAVFVAMIQDHPKDSNMLQFPYFHTGMTYLEMKGFLAELQKDL